MNKLENSLVIDSNRDNIHPS